MIDIATSTTPPAPPAARTVSVGAYARDYLNRLLGGDVGSLPAVLGLLVLCVLFAWFRPAFATVGNFANLFLQGAAVTVIAMGLVFVLLVGEIDLSAGYASGVCAAVLAALLTWQGQPWYVAVFVAMATGAAIGVVLGLLVAKIGIPSFVVTLAGFLAFQGVLLMVIRGGTIIPINDDVVLALVNRNLPPALGWAFAALCVIGFAAVQLFRQWRRMARGLVAPPVLVVVLRIVAVYLVLGVAVFLLNLERSRNAAIVSLKGVPIVVPLVAVLLVVGTFVLHRTQFGQLELGDLAPGHWRELPLDLFESENGQAR